MERSTLHASRTAREAELERETRKLYIWQAGSGGALEVVPERIVELHYVSGEYETKILQGSDSEASTVITLHIIPLKGHSVF